VSKKIKRRKQASSRTIYYVQNTCLKSPRRYSPASSRDVSCPGYAYISNDNGQCDNISFYPFCICYPVKTYFTDIAPHIPRRLSAVGNKNALHPPEYPVPVLN